MDCFCDFAGIFGDLGGVGCCGDGAVLGYVVGAEGFVGCVGWIALNGDSGWEQVFRFQWFPQMRVTGVLQPGAPRGRKAGLLVVLSRANRGATLW